MRVVHFDLVGDIGTVDKYQIKKCHTVLLIEYSIITFTIYLEVFEFSVPLFLINVNGNKIKEITMYIIGKNDKFLWCSGMY